MDVHITTLVFAAAMVFAIVTGASAHDAPHPAAREAEGMRIAATRFLDRLPASGRAQALRAFDDADRLQWHYTPRQRNGITLKSLDDAGRDAVHALLREALSAVGQRKVVNIIELEAVLREMETFGWMRDPERYHLTIYGKPDGKSAWGWRFEGHHLSLNFTLAGNRVAVDTPSFLGANPATVGSGPRKGLRVLAEEEDEARALLATLNEAQRREAIVDSRTYGDIVTANAQQVEPLADTGILAVKLDATQRAQLMKIIDVYARTFQEGLAQARLARVRDGGIDKIRFA
jgi:hypothetical protein